MHVACPCAGGAAEAHHRRPAVGPEADDGAAGAPLHLSVPCPQQRHECRQPGRLPASGERCAALRWRSVHVQKPTTLAARHLCQPASCSSKRVSVGCPTRPSTPCLLPTRPSTPPHPTIPAPQAVLVEEQAQALQQGLAQRGQQAQQGADLLGAALEVVQQLHAAGPVSVRGSLLEEAR